MWFGLLSVLPVQYSLVFYSSLKNSSLKVNLNSREGVGGELELTPNKLNEGQKPADDVS